MGVAYVVLAVDGWYEQIDERLKSRVVSTHFGLKVLDSSLSVGSNLTPAGSTGHSFFELHGLIPVICYSMYDQSTVLSE